MENKNNLFKLLGSSIIIVTILFSFEVFSQKIKLEATNCKYTGVQSDYCYASSGDQNVKVLRCSPGDTECFYDIDASN